MRGISANSKSIKNGDLFLAKKGMLFDGNHYIDEAVLGGACAVVTQCYNPFLTSITQVVVHSIEEIELLLAEKFYGNPSRSLFTIGVTGTSGKTTVVYMLQQLLDCAMLSTVEHRFGGRHLPSSMTTPDFWTMWNLMQEMVQKGERTLCMEVSSHALVQKRVNGIDFDIGIFTNLTHDHLDYHQDMEQYAHAKSLLFSSLRSEAIALICHDSPYANRMVQECRARVMTYSLCNPSADFYAKILDQNLFQTIFELFWKGKSILFTMPLTANHNVLNLTAALAAALLQGIEPYFLQKRVKLLKAPPGRLEKIDVKAPFDVFIDYAHKPEALRSILELLKPYVKGRLILVFGCGGDRDREKRPLMGKIGTYYADHTILTKDNSRNEDPRQIIEQIMEGVVKGSSYEVIYDRKLAIEKAMMIAREGDTLLIAGKGHELWMEEGKLRIPFDDKQVALSFFSPFFV